MRCQASRSRSRSARKRPSRLGIELLRHDRAGNQWATFAKYDDDGRVIWRANPSAVSGYDETRPDLLNNQSGNYQYLRDSAGVIETISYYTSTTADETTAGGVAGYQYETNLQKGETGTGILQSREQYFAHTGGGITVHPLATTTVFRNTDGTGTQTTSYAYTWFASSGEIESVTATLPVVSTAQNGPGTADVSTTFFDSFGRPIWHKDGDGFLTYTAYDAATSAVAKTITDVNTTQTGDFTGLPSGWSTPSGGGLHLVTQMEVDALGRTTKLTDPKGNITYTVFKDTNYEVRTYEGWQTGTNLPTGPTRLWREDRPGSYTESLTMSATPAVDGNGRPTGAEAVASVQTLTRTHTSSGGQVSQSDAYFNLTGLTYSTSTSLGTENTHFYRTRYGYDSHGLQNRLQASTGTITRTWFDAPGRVSSTWIGLDDTPTSGSWSPTNTAGTDLVKVSENVYDAGGIGDGNLTQVTQFPGGSAANRVTQLHYDWRNRQVAVKQGVEGTESTSLNRPIFYTELDNLGQGIAGEQYDGDNVTITDANSDGVPDKPSSSLLRARSTNEFDDQGRVFRSRTYSVDQSTGAVSSNSLTTDDWFDHRGLPIKTAMPGGLVEKMKFDGAGRTVKTFTTDGSGDTSWADAGTVTGDVVLTQIEQQYDANGNVILTITKDRFHDETATGELGNPTTAPKARVSYAAAYYDAADRLTASVDLGTNGGSAYTRPGTVPARSDTTLVVSYTFNAAGWIEDTTDPRGLVRRSLFDNLGRTTKTIEAYTDGTPSDTDDKTTEFTYDGSSHMLTLKALLTGGGYQKTEFVYGVSISAGSDINSNDILAATKYPDKSSGDASNSEKESYTVNALGDRKTLTDRNTSVHTYSYDVVSRITIDAVTTLASGVDGQVRRIETAYDTGGWAYLFTTYDAASGGNVVNQVQQGFNGLGQLTVEYQSHNGVVNTGTTPKVQYAYSEMSGGANHSRPTTLTYPNGRVITSNYSTGLDANISRLSSLLDGGTTLESYSYLGWGTVVIRAHPQPGVDLTYVKQSGEANGDAGDQYTGLDRFGRIVDQRWRKTSDGTHPDRFQYGYDRDSNRLYRDNLLNNSFDELYHANGASNGYDPLNQLVEFRRGALSDTNSDNIPDTVTTASRSQVWNHDALGNFDSLTTDGSGQTRSHNKQNQITSIQGLTTPTYDANGNMTLDQANKTLVYDAWNRLVDYKSGSTSLVSYKYDGFNRRIQETASSTTTDLYYSAEWQVLEERVSGNAKVQYVWSPVYVDAMIERDRDADINGSLEERLYVQQDANFNVTAVLNTSGVVQERYDYDPFSNPAILDAFWASRANSLYDWEYLHQGGRYEALTGLYHFRNRELSSALQRWEKPDPKGHQSKDLNLYCLVHNNPFLNADPQGLGEMPPPGGYKPTPPREQCMDWAKGEEAADKSWLATLPACPCYIGKNPTYNPNSYVWYDPTLLSQPNYYHPPEAIWEMRSKPTSFLGPGQQCTYTAEGVLIPDGEAAGTPDFVTPSNPLAFGLHWLHDVVPFHKCKEANMIDVYLKYRPPNDADNCATKKVTSLSGIAVHT